MTKMILKRFGISILILFGVSLIVFIVTLAEQRDPTGSPIQQYVAWLTGLFTGDLGTATSTGTPVGGVLGEPIVNSLALLTMAALIAIPVGILLGLYAALRYGTKRDTGLTWVSRMLSALPEFIVGIALLGLVATAASLLFPAVAASTPGSSGWTSPAQLLLPALTLALVSAPYIGRMTRASISTALSSRFVEMARLKGVPNNQLVFRHALPHAVGPVARALVVQLAWLLGAVVVVEYLFEYHGVGQVLIQSVLSRDVHVVQAVTLLAALICVVAKLGADVVNILVTPRLRSAA